MTELLLPGLDGANPLGFLAALGVLRTLSEQWPERRVRLGWKPADAWHPYATASGALSEDSVIEALHARLRAPGADEPFVVAPDLKLTVEQFRRWSVSAVNACDAVDRRFVDFVAAFGSDAVVNEGIVADTALRTMSGAGHQHFLATMALLVATTTPEHLKKALFLPWVYDDPLERRSLRWDPIDDRRHAMRWNDPSTDTTKRAGGAVQGANRLAIEGLSLFPTAPNHRRLGTVAFTGTRAGDTFFKYPIWTAAVTLDVVRSVIALASVVDAENESSRRVLIRIGIAEVFRSQRITDGKFRSFSRTTAV